MVFWYVYDITKGGLISRVSPTSRCPTFVPEYLFKKPVFVITASYPLRENGPRWQQNCCWIIWMYSNLWLDSKRHSLQCKYAWSETAADFALSSVCNLTDINTDSQNQTQFRLSRRLCRQSDSLMMRCIYRKRYDTHTPYQKCVFINQLSDCCSIKKHKEKIKFTSSLILETGAYFTRPASKRLQFALRWCLQYNTEHSEYFYCVFYCLLMFLYS